MSTLLSFVPGEGHYRFSTTLTTTEGTGSYTFDVRWNNRDNDDAGGWRFDMFDPDQILMVAGVKVVLNIPLGRRSTHPFFNHNSIVAIDSSPSKLDPEFDDIGTRVKLWHLEEKDLVSLRVR